MKHKAARKLTASPVKKICKFAATKSYEPAPYANHKVILVESPLERDYCYHLEDDVTVVFYQPQPITLNFESSIYGRMEYTPDFEVIYASGEKSYIEIKQDISKLNDRYIHKLECASKLMMGMGYCFKVVDETLIRQQPLLSNLGKLQRYRVHGELSKRLINSLKDKLPISSTLGGLIDTRCELSIKNIYQLVAAKVIRLDLINSKIDMCSEIYYA